ncbi:MAG TPA: peptide chain release factor 1 [Chloroflexota bacterium]
MLDRLQSLEDRYEELGELMSRPGVMEDMGQLQRYAKEHSDLETIVSHFRQLKRIDVGIEEARELLADGAQEEPELRELAREELRSLEEAREEQVDFLKKALVPKDPTDDKSAIVEIRAAAGGEEAALFARELFRMYTLYSEQQNWRTEILDANETGIGGFKEIIFEVSGKGAFGKMKYESGVHRVQRVPTTESGGRIHTSTATVIVMPEVEEFDIEIKPEDLRIDVYRSTGHGGQGVNTTDSAVRITHLPTGMVVTCQNERSQLKNKASALSVLRARLYDMEEEKRQKELGAARKSQVQTGDRSEKIRTYNFPQDRLTDHRIGLTVHSLPSILNGAIGPVIDQLVMLDQKQKLADE